jgi:hypothetical protein
MDRLPITSVTGQPVRRHSDDEPFVRFLIFGPNGDLLASVNLDGNGEKFVPGACVACHGGTGYFALASDSDTEPAASEPIFGGFPELGVLDGADLGSYFLPYDVDNFQFHSTRHPYTKDDQQSAIFKLSYSAWQTNVDIANVNAGRPNQETPQAMAFDSLFHGWYPNSSTFNSTYVAAPYKQPQTDPFSEFLYTHVVARSCRTCHIAMDYANFDREVPPSNTLQNLVCGQFFTGPPQGPFGRESSYTMPNSRVTFDRFWLSDQSNELTDHYKFACKLP